MTNLNNDAYKGYRLADALKYEGYIAPVTKYMPIEKHHSEKWPDSIVAEYYKRKTPQIKPSIFTLGYFGNKSVDIKLLKEIVKDRSLTSGHEYVAVHLRTGDILQSYDSYTETITSENFKPYFVEPKKYEEIAVQIKSLGYTHVFFVCGIHYPSKIRTQKTLQYIEDVKRRFNEKDINVEIKSGTPDEDFVFLSNADVLVTSGGEFSRFSGKINENLVIHAEKKYPLYVDKDIIFYIVIILIIYLFLYIKYARTYR